MALLIATVASLTTISVAAAEADAPDDIATPVEVVTIANEGGAREGHTPTAFAGMGSGLFAGDNLNPSFPDGVGVQTYLTFVIPPGLDVSNARIVSDALLVSGTPFEDLGPLVAEPIDYQSFGPELFDLEPTGPSTECTLTSATSIECDVTEALRVVAAEDKSEAQFRIRFETPGDNDGSQDLAMFFRSGSNTNEVGLFELMITSNP